MNQVSKNRAKNHWHGLRTSVKKRRFSYCIFTTTGSFSDDCARIRLLLSKFTKVVALGGDGTLNLAVNALIGSCCTLALLPYGTGNDFSRGFNCKEGD
ncbi:diacylglycerol kinase family protein [Pseudoalteromonas sp. BSi20652]|uniref:diacylglycerol/lipid kinase family protein n=1 Tax=Pseudoalteromonas sp. BSi20652 TaxID=388384 RepID=UPI001ED90B73